METKQIKFMAHYATDGLAKVRCTYSRGQQCVDGVPTDCVTVYAKSYCESLRPVLGDLVKNGTDSQTDYFEHDHATMFAGHPLYAAALARAIETENKYRASAEKRMAKCVAYHAARA